ncbi:glycosyltransferase family 4 protein [Muricoccus radiodurans]|uniref:glycosyltransferase family 4 protein n=1 Tax=Muricoccus radiodurans TaxID=2231721 RepID=UPI003CEDA6E6
MMPPPIAAPLRRLLVPLPSGRMGGAEAHTLRLCDAAATLGVAVTVAAEPDLLDRLRGPGREVLPARLAWRRGLVESARAAQAEAAATAMAAASPDAVLLPLPWPDHAAGVMEVLAATGLPALVVAHLVPHDPPPGVDGVLQEIARGMRAAWTAVATPTAHRLAQQLGLPRGTVTVVPNGVDAPVRADPFSFHATLGLAPGARVALFLGRLDRGKGADLLPDMAEAIARRMPGAVLACAGDGPLRASLESAAPPGHPLRLLGHSSRPAALLRAADALLMPSRLEGAPLTFLEAALCDLPVIATPQALEAEPEPGRLAWLAPAEDPVAFAEALEALLANPAETARRAAAARRLAAAHDGAAMAAHHLALLRALVAMAPDRPAWHAPGRVG